MQPRIGNALTSFHWNGESARVHKTKGLTDSTNSRNKPYDLFRRISNTARRQLIARPGL
jgi:hypothetical protein